MMVSQAETTFQIPHRKSKNAKLAAVCYKARPVSAAGQTMGVLVRKKLSVAEQMAHGEQVHRLAGEDRFLLDPRSNRWMPMWDLVMLFALLFTAIWTPYEVTFLEEADVLRDGPDFLWIFNRVLDSLFIADIILLCNTMYEESLEMGGHWVAKRRSQ